MADGAGTPAAEGVPGASRVEQVDPEIHRILSRRGGDADAQFALGMIAHREGRHEAAVDGIERAIAIDPTNPDYPHVLGAVYLALGKPDRAAELLQVALRLRPDHAPARRDLARLFAAQGRAEEAAACYREVLRIDPGEAESHLFLGQILAHSGRVDEALECCHQAVRLKADDPEAHRSLAALQLRRGRIEDAASSYSNALRLRPDDPDVLNELGISLARLRRFEQAADSYRHAIRLRPDFADAHNNLGNALRNLGRVDEAIASYREALRLRPNYPEAHNNLAIALRRKGQFDEAIASYLEALRLRPTYAEAHNNLGYALASRGKHDAAVISYHQAIRLKPDYVEAFENLGSALSDMGRHADAVGAFRQAVRLRPGDAKLHKGLGIALARHDKLDEAAGAYIEAIRLRPDFADAHNDLGITRSRQNRFEEAEASYREAIRCRPDYAEAHNNLGNALRNLGKFDEAMGCYRRAVELKPTYADAYNNRGIAYSEMGRFDEAIASYTECIKLRPNHVDAHMNRALTWLRKGDFAQGWAEYEWRWKKRAVSAKPLIQPLWNGFPLAGRRILLITEQGLGDTIQFIRYAAALRRQGATVILECPEKLAKILARTAGIDEFVPQGKDFPDYDVHAPMLTLPGLVDTDLTNIPAEVPYIHTDPDLVEHWRRELSGYREFKVGINWQGNPKYGGDRHRSMPLTYFEPLARVPGVKLFSLQKNDGLQQLKELGGRFEVVDLGSRLDEVNGPFMDTAAVMKNLDLFVTSDTAVAHLAGSLGIPVWVATSATPGWQWLSGREDCPWYPTMRLFRQAALMDWAPVFERIARELAGLVPLACRIGPMTVELTPAELLDRFAALGVEAEHAADLATIAPRLAVLEGACRRLLGEIPALVDVAAELRSVHEALRRGEQGLRAFEREGDFGVRYVILARSLGDQRERREELLRRVEALVAPMSSGRP